MPDQVLSIRFWPERAAITIIDRVIQAGGKRVAERRALWPKEPFATLERQTVAGRGVLNSARQTAIL